MNTERNKRMKKKYIFVKLYFFFKKKSSFNWEYFFFFFLSFSLALRLWCVDRLKFLDGFPVVRLRLFSVFGATEYTENTCILHDDFTSGRTRSLLVRRATGTFSRWATARNRAAKRTIFYRRAAVLWTRWGPLWTAISSWRRKPGKRPRCAIYRTACDRKKKKKNKKKREKNEKRTRTYRPPGTKKLRLIYVHAFAGWPNVYKYMYIFLYFFTHANDWPA